MRISTTVQADRLAEARRLVATRDSQLLDRAVQALIDDINLDNVELVPVLRLLRPGGSVPPGRWPEFCSAMASVLDC